MYLFVNDEIPAAYSAQKKKNFTAINPHFLRPNSDFMGSTMTNNQT